MPDETIRISKEDLNELKSLYEATPAEGIFIFKGREILKEYAEYMIEYLETKFGGTQ